MSAAIDRLQSRSLTQADIRLIEKSPMLSAIRDSARKQELERREVILASIATIADEFKSRDEELRTQVDALEKKLNAARTVVEDLLVELGPFVNERLLIASSADYRTNKLRTDLRNSCGVEAEELWRAISRTEDFVRRSLMTAVTVDKSQINPQFREKVVSNAGTINAQLVLLRNARTELLRVTECEIDVANECRRIREELKRQGVVLVEQNHPQP